MSFTCPRCRRTSRNPNDEREGYCGACHDWTGVPGGGSARRALLVGGPAHGMVMPLPAGGPSFEAIHVAQEGARPALYCDTAYITPSGRRVYAAQGVTVNRNSVRLPLPAVEEMAGGEPARRFAYVNLFSRALALFMDEATAAGYQPVELPRVEYLDHPGLPILVVHGAVFKDQTPPARTVEATPALGFGGPPGQ